MLVMFFPITHENKCIPVRSPSVFQLRSPLGQHWPLAGAGDMLVECLHTGTSVQAAPVLPSPKLACSSRPPGTPVHCSWTQASSSKGGCRVPRAEPLLWEALWVHRVNTCPRAVLSAHEQNVPPPRSCGQPGSLGERSSGEEGAWRKGLRPWGCSDLTLPLGSVDK